ncbi:hypothetical protein HK102_013576 [Quaeritorhiza haematococci]|nr:hypothetical protein HK102_013576 [Quaeritorhiza haematococci]
MALDVYISLTLGTTPVPAMRSSCSEKPLTDEDRWPWLETLCALIWSSSRSSTPDDAANELVILACSALKRAYRDVLRRNPHNSTNDPQVGKDNSSKASDSLGGPQSDRRITFIYLHAPKEVVLKRLEDREGHYMKAQMLDSQFEALEEPDPQVEEDVVWVSTVGSPEQAMLQLQNVVKL